MICLHCGTTAPSGVPFLSLAWHHGECEVFTSPQEKVYLSLTRAELAACQPGSDTITVRPEGGPTFMGIGRLWPRIVGEKTAEAVIEAFEPYVSRIDIAGSLRRECKFVRDLDLIIIPKKGKRTALDDYIVETCADEGTQVVGGDAITRFKWLDFTIDIYWATKETFVMLKMVRTGSAEHNIEMAMRAKAKGWAWHTAGYLTDPTGKRRIPRTEQQIFNWLDTPYLAPEHRGGISQPSRERA